jgi:hypothetical protein
MMLKHGGAWSVFNREIEIESESQAHMTIPYEKSSSYTYAYQLCNEQDRQNWKVQVSGIIRACNV